MRPPSAVTALGDRRDRLGAVDDVEPDGGGLGRTPTGHAGSLAQPREPRPAAPGRRSLTVSSSGSMPAGRVVLLERQPEPAERLARRGRIGGRQHQRAVGVLGHADDPGDVHAALAERGRDPGERARPIVELDREPDRHETPPVDPDGTRSRSARYACAACPPRSARRRRRRCPTSRSSAARIRRRRGPPSGSSASGGSSSTTHDLRKRPLAAGELRRFTERLGARAVLDETSRAYLDAGLGYLSMDDGAIVAQAPRRPAAAAAAAGPLRQRGHGRSGRGRLDALAQAFGRLLTAVTATTTPTTTRTAPTTAHVMSSVMKPAAADDARALADPDEPDQDQDPGDERSCPHDGLLGVILARMPDETLPTARRRAGRMRVTPEAEHRMGRANAATEDEKFLERQPGAELPRHRPVARAAHPLRVRRGLRRDGRGRPGGDRVRLGADRAERPALRAGADDRPAAGRGRLRGHHRRRPGHHGGRQPRLPGGRRAVGRLQHRAAARAGAQPVRRPRRRVPLLLRAQDDVREVRGRVRDPARRLRDARRAVRGAHAHPDRQGPPLPGRAGRARRTGPGCSTGSAARSWRRARSARRTSTCSTSPTIPRRPSRSIRYATRRRPHRRAERLGARSSADRPVSPGARPR